MITFILVLCIFTVLVAILYLNSKKSKVEQFLSSPNNNSDQKRNRITYTLNDDINGPPAYLYGIDSFSSGFYEQINHDNPDQDDCQNDEECGINGVCLERGNTLRCNKIIKQEAFRFDKNKKSHIIIPNVNPELINISFIVLINNALQLNPIILTSNKSWDLVVENKKFKINVYSHNKVKTYTANFNLENHKLYEVIIKIQNNNMSISLDKRIMNIQLLKRECTTDNNCKYKNTPGTCIVSAVGANFCSYNKIDLVLGMRNNNQDEEEYLSGYIGSIKLNKDIGDFDSDKCTFNSEKFKNKRLCNQECKRQNNCDENNCDSLCEKVQVCEFEPTGRHEEDCIQQCIKNNDCTFEFCNDKCKNCGLSCPWNNLDESELFDSSHYDKKGRPSPARISIINISSDGRKVSLRWKVPHEGKAPIKGYTSFLYKTFNKSEGVKINNINTNNCGEFCNFILGNLNSQETYTIGIKAFNSYGLGKISNLLTFKTDKKSISKDFSVVPNIDESVIGEFNYCHEIKEE